MRAPTAEELRVLEPGPPGEGAADATIQECVRNGWAEWRPNDEGSCSLWTTELGELAIRIARGALR